MGDPERAGDVLGHVLEPEFPGDLDCSLGRAGIDDPLELEVGLGGRFGIAPVLLQDALLPAGQVPVQR